MHAFVTSKLDSCNGVLTGLPDKEINKLQREQNAEARLVAGAKKQGHITPVLQVLHWLPNRARIDFKILLITYKDQTIDLKSSQNTNQRANFVPLKRTC